MGQLEFQQTASRQAIADPAQAVADGLVRMMNLTPSPTGYSDNERGKVFEKILKKSLVPVTFRVGATIIFLGRKDNGIELSIIEHSQPLLNETGGYGQSHFMYEPKGKFLSHSRRSLPSPNQETQPLQAMTESQAKLVGDYVLKILQDKKRAVPILR